MKKCFPQQEHGHQQRLSHPTDCKQGAGKWRGRAIRMQRFIQCPGPVGLIQQCCCCQAVSQKKFATSDLVWETETSGTEVAVGICGSTVGPQWAHCGSTVGSCFPCFGESQAFYLMEGALQYQLGKLEAA